MEKTYWFEVTDEDSDLCGEEFFVEVEDGFGSLKKAWEVVRENFGDIKITCLGPVGPFQAAMMGLDTY